MSATKKGFSSKEIQRQLGLKRYKPVLQWYLNYLKPWEGEMTAIH
jgi:hypothetical protein